MTSFVDILTGWLGWASLVYLPGAYVLFGLKLDQLSFGIRAISSILISPIVVVAQFYLLRLLNFDFNNCCYILIVLNLPALVLMWYRRPTEFKIDRALSLGICVAIIAAVLGLLPHLLHPELRAFSGHAWTHGDFIYQISNGALWPEEPELAGVRIAYPWLGHVYQAILSFLIGSAPVESYIWTNLIWIISIAVVMIYVVKELAGSWLACCCAPVWLYFGLNWLGYVLNFLVPASMGKWVWIGGDYRYTPWILKFYFFEQIIFGLGLISLIVLLLVRSETRRVNGSALLLLFISLAGVGLFYPILFPAAAVIVFSSILWTFIRSRSFTGEEERAHNIYAALVLLCSGVVWFANFKLVTINRATPGVLLPALTRHFLTYSFLKSQGTVAAVLVLFVTAGFVLRYHKTKISPTISFLLIVPAVILVLLNIVVELPFWGNEYKYLMVAAICLNPFAALATEYLTHDSVFQKCVALILVTTLLSVPFAYKLNVDYPWWPVIRGNPPRFLPQPALDLLEFNMRLQPGEELSSICEKVRLNSKPNSIILVERSELHFPTLTQRSLYVSPEQENFRAGVNLSSNDLILNVRGYDEKLVENRKLVSAQLFSSKTESECQQALDKVSDLGRPLNIILEPAINDGLRNCLLINRNFRLLAEQGNYEAWIN
jgi:hypothetical protein